MSKLNCNIVRDILPLYADKVVCEDTRKLVDDHLMDCPGCQMELDAMRQKVTIPVQVNTAASIKNLRNKWGKKQLWKGYFIAFAFFAVLFGGYYFYNHGFPACSNSIYVETEVENLHGFVNKQEQMGLDLDNAQITGARQWNIRFEAEDGVQLFVEEESVWEENADGELIKVSTRLYVRTFPFAIPGDLSNILNVCPTSMTPFRSWDDIPSSGDCTVTIVFADKEITFFMREEGLWGPAVDSTANDG